MARQVVSVFGLGSMGLGVACSALAGGHDVFGFDINSESQSKFIARGGQSGVMENTIAKSNVVVSVVLNGAQTEDLFFGVKGVVPQMQAGSVVVSCATWPLKQPKGLPINVTIIKSFISMHLFREGLSKRQMVH